MSGVKVDTPSLGRQERFRPILAAGKDEFPRGEAERLSAIMTSRQLSHLLLTGGSNRTFAAA
jgi:hypothetical protein